MRVFCRSLASKVGDKHVRAPKLYTVTPGRPRLDAAQGSAEGELADLGLEANSDVRKLWRVAADAPQLDGRTVEPVRTLMGALSAARLAASALNHRWIEPLLEIMRRQLERLRRLSVVGRDRSTDKMLPQLLEALGRCSMEAAERFGGRARRRLDSETGIHLLATLDTLYYDIFHLHLQTGGGSCPIPPPHKYFPAIAARVPGGKCAAKALLDSLDEGMRGRFMETWQLEEVNGSATLPQGKSEQNPLLAVMWARFKEGSRLLPGLDSSAARQIPRCKSGGDSREGKRSERGNAVIAQSGSNKRAAAPVSKKRRVAAFTPPDRPVPRANVTDDSSSSSGEAFESGDDSSDGGGSTASDGSGASDLRETSRGRERGSHLHTPYSGGSGRDKVPRPWPGHSALTAWRESSRECHFYAYAAPTEAALDLLASKAPLVEIGAGTGYWARLLSQRGVAVATFDSHPPSSGRENAFHGHTPAIHEGVKAGGPRALQGFPGAALLLCYPPFGSPMALECVNAFRGQAVFVVGEWDGDTATPAFTDALLRGFRLTRRLPLPNWSDSCHELTLWERDFAAGKQGRKSDKRGKREKRQDSAAPRDAHLRSCCGCGRSQAECLEQGNLLRRCRWCREAVYCSPTCCREDAARHTASHRLRWICLGRHSPKLSSDADYETIGI